MNKIEHVETLNRRFSIAVNGGNKNERDLKPIPYPPLQTLQTATTLELQMTSFCFLLRVIGCLF